MLTRDDILRAFTAVAGDLRSRGEGGEIILVGGAALVLVYGARAATRDVDAISLRPSASLSAAALRVAAAQGLPVDWLNDRARAFASTASEGPVVFAADSLTVRAATGVQLLAMKLSAMRDRTMPMQAPS